MPFCTALLLTKLLLSHVSQSVLLYGAGVGVELANPSAEEAEAQRGGAEWGVKCTAAEAEAQR